MRITYEQDDLKNRVRELAMLNEVGRALSSTIKINDLMEVIYEQTTRVMEVSAFYIALYIKEKNSLQFIFDVLNGKRQPDEERLRKFGNGRTEYIIRNKKPLLIKSNPQKIYRELGIVSADLKARATAGVPMIVGGKAIGALVVQSYDKDEAYDKHHIELLSTIASQAAIAIENARMFEAIDRQRQQLAHAKNITDNILNNVKDGLFLLNNNLRIESQYSAALAMIMEEKRIAGRKLTALLGKKVDQQLIHSVEEYLSLMFNNQLDESMLHDLNPLQHVKTTFSGNDRIKTTKYLTFYFRRIIQNDKIVHIIGTVNDITKQTVLAKQLEESQAAEKNQMEILFAMLNVDSQMLQEFMNSVHEELTVIRSLLNTKINKNILGDIYRSVHTIKGNASMLQLDFFAESAHEFEEILANIAQKGKVNKNQYERLKESYLKLKEIYDQMDKLINRIKSFQMNYRPTRKHESQLMFKSLESMCNSIAQKTHKRVKLNYSRYKPELIPNKYRLVLRDIFIQLVRNAIYHGIEREEERIKNNKPAEGRIDIFNKIENGTLHIIFKDDGRGLQLNKVKDAALRLGKFSSAELAEMKRSQLMQLIFEEGVTTADKTDITAGRGVGMDIIREKILKENGRIEISSEQNKFTQFEIILDI